MSIPPSLTTQTHILSPHSLIEAHTPESQRTLEWNNPESSPNSYGHSVGAKKDTVDSRPSAESSIVHKLYDYSPILAETPPPCAELPHLLQTKKRQSLGRSRSPHTLQSMGITDNHIPGQKSIEAAETSVTLMHENENQTVAQGGSSIIKIRIPRQICKGEPVNSMYTQDTAEEQSDRKPGNFLNCPMQTT